MLDFFFFFKGICPFSPVLFACTYYNLDTNGDRIKILVYKEQG